MTVNYPSDPLNPKAKPVFDPDRIERDEERYQERESAERAREAADAEVSDLVDVGTSAGMDAESAEATAEVATDFSLDTPAMSQIAAAAMRIQEAGGDGGAAQQFLTEAQADLIVAFPQLANAWAAKFPMGKVKNYSVALAEYGFLEQDVAQQARGQKGFFEGFYGGSDSPAAQSFGNVASSISDTLSEAVGGKASNKQGVRKGKNGSVLYENGVIAATDPQTGTPTVIFPNAQRNVPGSPQWLEKVRKTWKPDEVKKWRKRLAQYGYISADEGGMAQDLVDGLREYHRQRYLNHGQAVPLQPGEATGDIKLKDIMVGPTQIRNQTRERLMMMYGGDEPTEKEVDQWSAFVTETARHLLKSGHNPEDVANEAGAIFEEETIQDPQMRYFRESEEENMELHDTVINSLAALNGMRG